MVDTDDLCDTNGRVRFNPEKGILQICVDDEWIPVYKPPLGTLANPGDDCAAIAEEFGDDIEGVFYLIQGRAVCHGAEIAGGDGLSEENPAPNCGFIEDNFPGVRAGTYWIGNSESLCLFGVPEPNSCEDLRVKAGQAGVTLTTGVYTINAGERFDVWCEVASGHAWTLAMKFWGGSGTYVYDNGIWTNQNTHHANEYQHGLRSHDFKGKAFYRVPVSYLRLGMKRNGQSDSQIRWQIMRNDHNRGTWKLRDIFGHGNNRDCGCDMNRGKWYALSDNPSLQHHCNRQGFNVHHTGARVRIGTITNQEGNCGSPDSRLGFGGRGSWCGQHYNNACGNECRCSCQHGDRSEYRWGFIMIR